jgi:hypothetical protein
MLGYLEEFYNPTRRHSPIGYVESVNFESTQLAEFGVHETGSGPSFTNCNNRLFGLIKVRA